jgi:branched-chain amino acid transport system permease protein
MQHPRARGIFIRRNTYLQWILLAGVLSAALPWIVNPYWLKFVSFMLVSLVIASSWNLIGGYCNYFSFGHGVFFGIGAYVVAIFYIRYQLNFFFCLLLAGAVSATIALIISPLLRLKGLNFALATLALLEAMRIIFQKWSFTRGMKTYDAGWNFQSGFSDMAFFYLILGVFILMLLTFVLFLSSRFGFATAGIKTNESMAKGLGINTTLCRILAFLLSAFWVGVIGGIYAPMISYISTQSIFGIGWSIKPIIISILGGIGTLIGPILGGVILIFIDQLLWERFLELHTLIYGALLILIVLFLPNGLINYRAKAAGLLEGLRRRKTDVEETRHHAES